MKQGLCVFCLLLHTAHVCPFLFLELFCTFVVFLVRSLQLVTAAAHNSRTYVLPHFYQQYFGAFTHF